MNEAEIFPELKVKISKAINNRSIATSVEKMKRYENGQYNPSFSLVMREGQLMCVWCGNRTKKKEQFMDGNVSRTRVVVEAEAYRLTNKNCKDGFTPSEWDVVGLNVLNYLKDRGLLKALFPLNEDTE